MIDGHAGSRQEAGDRGDVEDAATMALQAVDEGERQVGQSPHIDVDHAELLGAVEVDGAADQAEAGIVDDDVGL
jgi:hypothetical protein